MTTVPSIYGGGMLRFAILFEYCLRLKKQRIFSTIDIDGFFEAAQKPQARQQRLGYLYVITLTFIHRTRLVFLFRRTRLSALARRLLLFS